MTRYIHPAKKRRLGKLGKRTKWAPFWIIPKIAGIGKKFTLQDLVLEKDIGEEQKLKHKNGKNI